MKFWLFWNFSYLLYFYLLSDITKKKLLAYSLVNPEKTVFPNFPFSQVQRGLAPKCNFVVACANNFCVFVIGCITGVWREGKQVQKKVTGKVQSMETLSFKNWALKRKNNKRQKEFFCLRYKMLKLQKIKLIISYWGESERHGA